MAWLTWNHSGQALRKQMAVYALLFWVLVRVIQIAVDRPRARTVTRSTREQTPGGPG